MKRCLQLFQLTLLFVGLSVGWNAAVAQCNTSFLDSGGTAANYSSSENITTTICPDNAGDVVTVTFTAYDTESGYDFLNVYDGADATTPIQENISGTSIPGPYASTDASGCLTFVFTSDGSVTRSGWESNVTCAPPPSCPSPTNVTVLNVTDTDAEVSFTTNSAATGGYTAIYGAPGFDPASTVPGVATSVSGAASPLSLSGLTETTTYEVYVQSDCGANGTNIDGPATFTTLVTPPMNNDCSGAIAITPSPAGTGCTSPTFTLPFSTDGTSDSGVDGSCNTTNTGLDQWFTWTATTDGLTFQSNTLGGPGIVIYDACGGSEIDCIQTVQYTPNILSGWAVGDNLLIQIYDYGTSVSDVAFCLEEYMFPSCLEVTATGSTNVLSESADITFTGTATATDGYSVIYGLDGFDPTVSTEIIGTVPGAISPVSLTGLSASTAYDAYVRSECGTNGTSLLTGPVGFTTTAAPPACGGKFYDSGGATGQYTANEDINTLICPDNAGDVVTVTFLSFNTEATYDFLTVYNGSDATAPVLATLDGTTNPGAFTSTDASGCLFFNFDSDGSGQRDGWDADVTCALPPTCPSPTSLTATNIMDTQVELGWSEVTGVAGYDYLVQTTGSPAPDATTTPTGSVTGSANTSTLTGGLISTTNYDAYVRSTCTGGDVGDWTGPEAFTTLATPPANDECTGATVLTCGAALTGETTVNATGSSSSSCLQSQGNNVWYQFVGTGDIVDITATATDPTDGFEPQVDLYTSTDGTCATITCAQGQGEGSATVVLNFTSVVGTVYFISIGEWISSGPDGVFDLSVTCTAPPTCPSPATLVAGSETDTSVELLWDEATTAAGYDYLIQLASALAPDATTTPTGSVSGSANTSIVSGGLVATTDYVAYVRSTCTGGDLGDWTGPEAFTTLATPPANDACTDAIALIDGQGNPTAASGVTYNTSATNPAQSGPDLDCGGFAGSNPDDDIWFSVNVPTNSSVTITVSGAPDLVIQAYTGGCGALVGDVCEDDGGGSESVTLTDGGTNSLLATTYLVQVFVYGTGGGEFTVTATSAALLPAELTKFTGNADGLANRLDWTTATEVNVDRFFVERSGNGTDWTTVGDVTAAGNSSELVDYQFLDRQPLNRAYYRLRTVDFDGYTELSDVIEITRPRGNGDVVIAPNPTKGETLMTLDLTSADDLTLTVTDITGRVVSRTAHTLTEGAHTLALDMSDHASGVYFLQLQGRTLQLTERLVKE